MTCTYLDSGIGPVTVLGTIPSQRFVLDERLEDLAEIHAQGTNISYALEYAAKLGKNQVTQHLITIGVPVTRIALMNAAARRGPGMDLLLAGLEGDDLAKASSAAASFRMAARDCERAYSMLEAGTKPDRYFLSSSYSGLANQPAVDWQPEFHVALDKLLSHVSREVLAESHLEFLVEHGRPVHIERALELLQRPVAALLPRVLCLNSVEPLTKLRAFGAPISDEAFGICVREATFDGKNHPERYIDRLCSLALADDCEGRISARNAAPLLVMLLQQKSMWMLTGRTSDSQSFDRFRLSLGALIPCVVVDERAQLHATLDAWNVNKPSNMKLPPPALKDVHDLIDDVSIEIMDLSQLSCAP